MTDLTDDEYREAADAVYETLLSRLGEGSPRPRLAPTRRAVELLGDPQRAYPIIHVTGTNGKTSTSRIIESILRAYGLRVGLFTSPHLLRFNERFMIDGEPISDEALARNWDDVAPYVQMADAELVEQGEQRLTFFEVITVLAFACFADAPVDVAVIEVGLGGTWDSTNVADGTVSVITPVAVDHAHLLGADPVTIAGEKSGIIKAGGTTVMAQQSLEVFEVLLRKAADVGAQVAREGIEFGVVSRALAVGGQVVSLKGLGGEYDDLFIFDEVGWNFEPAEISAAFGVVQMRKLPINLARRKRNFEMLSKHFSGYPEVFVLPRITTDVDTGWHMFPIMIKPESGVRRSLFQQHMEAAGVDTRMVWTGNVTRQPAFKNVPHRIGPGGLPNADRVMETGLILPCNHAIDDEGIEYMCHTVDQFFNGAR